MLDSPISHKRNNGHILSAGIVRTILTMIDKQLVQSSSKASQKCQSVRDCTKVQGEELH